MPFTKKFFSLNLQKKDVVADKERLQALYSNRPPVYFEDWLEAQPKDVKETYAKKHKVSDIERLKTSAEYQQSWQQIQILIGAIQDWAVKNSIKDSNNWTTLLERLLNEPSYLPDQDIPKWLSRGKKAFEKIYLLLKYSDTISLPQKKQVILQLSSSQMNILCSPGVLSRIEDAPLDLLTDWSSRLMNARLKIVQECAQNYFAEHWPNLISGNEIHYVNALRNYVADVLYVPFQEDIFSPQNLSWEEDLIPFAEKAKAAIQISTIADRLTQDLLTTFEGNFSLENFEELKKLGKELNLLGKDRYLINNCMGSDRLNAGEEDEALCHWLFKVDDDGEYTPRSLEEIQFIIQCTITARLNDAGYMTENTIEPIKLDDKYQLILIPEAINASWIQSNEAKTPPESLDKFLERNPQYHDEIMRHLRDLLFMERIEELPIKIFAKQILKLGADQFQNELKKKLLEFPKELRLLFLVLIKDCCGKLDIPIFPFITHLPENEARIKFLKSIVVSKLKHITYSDLKDVLSELPEESRFLFLDKLKNYLTCLTNITIEQSLGLIGLLPKDETRLKFLEVIVRKEKIKDISGRNLAEIITYLPEEDYIKFLKLLDNFVIFLFYLPSDKQFPFLEKNEFVCLSLVRNFSDLEEIRNGFLKREGLERYRKFLSLSGVKHRLADLVKADERLRHYYVAATLLSLPEETRFPYLENNLDEWVKSIKNWDALTDIEMGLPHHMQGKKFLNLIGVNNLIAIIKNSHHLYRILDILELGNRLSFVQANWNQWPDLEFYYSDIESFILKFKPEERIRFLDLLSKDKWVKAIDSKSDLVKILNLLPKKELLSFLQNQKKLVRKSIYAKADDYTKKGWLDAIKKLNYWSFPKNKSKRFKITKKFTALLDYLPEKDRLSFLKDYLCSASMLTKEGFIEIINRYLPPNYLQEFFGFLDGNDLVSLFTIRDNYVDYSSLIKRVLQDLAARSRFIFVKSFWSALLFHFNEVNVNLFCEIVNFLPKNDYEAFFQFFDEKIPDFLINQTLNLIRLFSLLPEEARWPFLQQQVLAGNIKTEDNVREIIKTLRVCNNSSNTLQKFLHMKNIKPIVFNFNLEKFSPPPLQYLINSVSRRKKIEQSLNVLETKANSLTENSYGKQQETLKLVNKLRKATDEYFSQADLRDKKSAENYVAECKKLTKQAHVDPENRIDAYREEFGFGQLINRILITIATVLSAFTFLVVPAMRYTFLGKTETQALTENVVEGIENVEKAIPRP